MSPFPNRFNPPQSGRKYEQDEIGIRLAPRCFGDDVARNRLLGVGDSNSNPLDSRKEGSREKGNRGLENREKNN